MSDIGYFTEVEMLQKKIKELESKLEEERMEFRERFQQMRLVNIQIQNSSSNVACNPFYEEVCALREENAILKEQLAQYL